MLEVSKLSKEYAVAGERMRVLSEIDMKLDSGDAVSIVGPSGSGKSTLLYILGALEPPSAGTVMLDGENPYDMDEKTVAAFRNRKIGFVFQDHHLLPQCTVIENVLIPTLVAQPDDRSRNGPMIFSSKSGFAPGSIIIQTNFQGVKNNA